MGHVFHPKHVARLESSSAFKRGRLICQDRVIDFCGCVWYFSLCVLSLRMTPPCGSEQGLLANV